MLLLIDNYDSFTYNLVQQAGSFNPHLRVVRNDTLTVEQIAALRPSHIILSPGPGYPKDAGICEELVHKLAGRFPILGVCLGHQGICEVYGAEISHARQLMHGKQSKIILDNSCPIFCGLPSKIEGARYHSLSARRDTIPDLLQVVAEDESGEVMAVKHKDYHVYGLQFHPESILTPRGDMIMQNFFALGGRAG